MWLLGAATLGGCEEDLGLSEYELFGRVTAFNEGAGGQAVPVAGAKVRFVSDTRLETGTSSDDSGRYRMRVTTDHAFGQVRAEADGFDPGEQSVYFDESFRRIDIELRRRRE